MKIQYLVGTSSYTPFYEIKNNNGMDIINKQLSMSVPLITGACLKDNHNIQNIYVGKEISLKDINERNYWIQKYDLPIDHLIDIALKGYKRACVLNYKKYDSVVVGVKDNDIIVPDYYALKNRIESL